VLSYKCLNTQEFQIDEYKIVPIRLEDRYDIMKWRNEQMYHLRQSKILTIEDQDFYFENVVSKLFDQENPKQILFSFLKNENCIGYGGLVHINWIDKNAEISFIMNTFFEKENFSKNWTYFLGLIENVAFNQIKLYKIFTFAYDLRPHLYKILENSGFVKEATLKNHIIFNGEFKNIIIHSKYRKIE
jgi:RimJ/RimL family protein N-acetyltransferase